MKQDHTTKSLDPILRPNLPIVGGVLGPLTGRPINAILNTLLKAKDVISGVFLGKKFALTSEFRVVTEIDTQDPYEFLKEPVRVYRIQALKDVPTRGIRKGDKGGFVESSSNLSQSGQSWVAGNAVVVGNTKVTGYGHVGDNAFVSGARIKGQVTGNSTILTNIYGVLAKGTNAHDHQTQLMGFVNLEGWGADEVGRRSTTAYQFTSPDPAS